VLKDSVQCAQFSPALDKCAKIRFSALSLAQQYLKWLPVYNILVTLLIFAKIVSVLKQMFQQVFSSRKSRFLKTRELEFVITKHIYSLIWVKGTVSRDFKNYLSFYRILNVHFCVTFDGF